MIKSITITNHLGESIKLEMTRPEKSGFLIKNIDGLLEPTKANINTTKIATLDGTSYNSAYLDARNIVMSLQFMSSPTESIEDLRQKTYEYFPMRKKIRLVAELDNRTVETSGYVEDNKPTIFSSNEGTSITILCTDPFLYSTETSDTVFSGVKPTFKFPFSNNSTTDPLLKMGSIERKSEAVIYYDGDSDTGVTINIHAIGEASNIVIHNVTAREQMRIDTAKLAALTGSGIIEGDTITIETRPRDKSITLLRDGKQINILNCLDRGTKWLKLSKGDNIFAYEAETGSSNLQFRISNKILYEGA